MLPLILLLIFCLAFLIQLIFYVKYFIPFARILAPQCIITPTLPVSVIIAAKNEFENLKKYLPLILDQDYKEFEVIVVDDNSMDETWKHLQKLNHQKLKIFQTGETSGKKMAIELGISKSCHNHLLFIDGDCFPASRKWLSNMISQFNDSIEIVIGYGQFIKTNGWLNSLIRFEGFLNAIQYFSFAIKGKAYMGVGRNLSYTKDLYDKSKSFSKYKSLKSGDDDLLVNEMSTEKNVAISINPQSHTLTKAETSWKSYFFQKRRHLQAGEKYKLEDRVRLLFFGLSSLLFYASFIILGILNSFLYLVLPIVLIKLIVQLLTFKKIMANLGERDLLPWIPILEFFFLMQISLIGVSTWFWKVDRWK